MCVIGYVNELIRHKKRERATQNHQALPKSLLVLVLWSTVHGPPEAPGWPHLDQQADDVVLDATVHSHDPDGVPFTVHSGLLAAGHTAQM